MGDEGRGTVWEEIIVNCPKDVALVALSATVKNVGRDRRLDHARPPPHRRHHASRAAGAAAVPGGRSVGRDPRATRPCASGKVRLLGDERDGRQRPGPLVHAPRGRPDRDAGRAGRARLAARDLLHLQPRRLRARHGDGARRGQAAPHEGRAAAGARRPSARPSEDNPTIAESPLNQTIFQALGMGVGLHHAGILPSVKRLIELLFERGLCKVVFATETMSLGIHMPAKSVVLQSLTKRTDRGFRSLTHNELTQMAGRAGRRGIDPEGQCVMALDVRDGLEDMKRVVDGPPEPIVSQFKLGYGSVALLLGDRAGHGDHPAHGRVLLRPVPEHEEDPRARGRGQEPRRRRCRRARLSRAVRRLLAHRPLPGPARRARGGADGARARRPARALRRRGRAGPARARAAEERRARSASSAASTAGVIARSSRCCCPTAAPSR